MNITAIVHYDQKSVLGFSLGNMLATVRCGVSFFTSVRVAKFSPVKTDRRPFLRRAWWRPGLRGHRAPGPSLRRKKKEESSCYIISFCSMASLCCCPASDWDSSVDHVRLRAQAGRHWKDTSRMKSVCPFLKCPFIRMSEMRGEEVHRHRETFLDPPVLDPPDWRKTLGFSHRESHPLAPGLGPGHNLWRPAGSSHWSHDLAGEREVRGAPQARRRKRAEPRQEDGRKKEPRNR